MHTISYAINYWSKGEVHANFLRHEGYLGAIGAFLKGADAGDTANYSWGENLYGSSAFQVFLDVDAHKKDLLNSLYFHRQLSFLNIHVIEIARIAAWKSIT